MKVLRGIIKVGLTSLFLINCVVLLPQTEGAETAGNGKQDSVQKDTSIKSWDNFIRKKQLHSSGLFNIYTEDNKYYLEVSDAIMGRDILFGGRVSEISNTSKVAAGEMRKDPIMIRFARGQKNLFMHQVVSDYIADSLDPVSISVKRNSITPILYSFPIEATGADLKSVIIDVTKLFTSEIPQVSPFNSKYKAGKLEPEATMIIEAIAFPENVELRTQMSYSNSDSEPVMVIMHYSILLLPEEVMMPRFEDPRIGYFATGKRFFSTQKIGVESQKFITRFNLRPRKEDMSRYFAGELVMPEKQIVFYIDNAFPPEWREQIKAGIEDWQKAFETVGFKDAIIAKDYPVDDPAFHPEDIRYSCIRYISMPKANSQGPSWIDPRSGEVIGGDVLWWHNVTELLRDWRFVQCGAVEPAARKENIDIELLGGLIRYVAAHEVGHCLGLKHNMRASYAFPVDSLRSATFTDKNGTTPSIMDYARFNYIAQPGDNVTNLAPPHMGPYDTYAISWGYKLIPNISDPRDEKEILNKWILDKAGDPIYNYGDQQMGISIDPSSQSESLGNDAVLAGTYGVKNARYIMDNLVPWTTTTNGDYKFLNHIYDELVKQYQRYLEHVISYLGGVYIYRTVEGEEMDYFTPLPRDKQREALNWVFNELSTQPEWILNSEVTKRIGPRKNDLFKYQTATLDKLMSPNVLSRLQLYHSAYGCAEYLNDIHDHIWLATKKKRKLSEYEKHLQASYIHNLRSLLSGTGSNQAPAQSDSSEYLANPSSSKISYLDNLVKPIALGKIHETKKLLRKGRKTGNEGDRLHYNYLYQLLEK